MTHDERIEAAAREIAGKCDFTAGPPELRDLARNVLSRHFPPIESADREKVERLVKAGKAMFEVHDYPCRLDHHGLCQEHHLRSVDGKGECEVQLMRDALAALESKEQKP